MYPDEKCMADRLLDDLAALLAVASAGRGLPAILNVGAVENENIDWELLARQVKYICDRVDVQICRSQVPSVRECWQCSVEDMALTPSEEYVAVVANWVLEHVEDVSGSAAEIARVLMDRGRFFATVPNPKAIEFIIARLTPNWFHGLIRGDRPIFPKYYAYQSIENLVEVFRNHRLQLVKISRGPSWEVYLWKYPVLRRIARGIDWLLQRLSIENLLGHVYLVFEKSDHGQASAHEYSITS